MTDDDFSPEEVFQVITAAGRPGEVARVTTFDPLSWHDVWVASTSSMVIVMAHAHAVKENDSFIPHTQTHIHRTLYSRLLAHKQSNRTSDH